MSSSATRILEIMAATMRDLELSDEELEHLAHPSSGLRARTAHMLNEQVQQVRQPLSVEVARQIMGRNFISIPDIATFMPSVVTVMDAPSLATIPFTAKDLRACFQSDILIADPGLSIREICELTGDRFVETPDFGGLPECYSEPYGTLKAEPCWRLIRKDGMGCRSFSGMEEQLLELNTMVDYVPTAREVFWMKIVYFSITSKVLFKTKLVRTSDLGTMGRICLGFFHSTQGMQFYQIRDTATDYSQLDLAVAKRPTILTRATTT